MKSVTIVGGGLAGLTLGIGLRQKNVPVTVLEAGNFPRHRVCGEFISGKGLESMTRLGLRQCLEAAGAVEGTTAAFFSETKSTGPRRLPARALCLSRFDMDAQLAGQFQGLGGELRTGFRFSEEFQESIVRATGRRPQTDNHGTRWFGLKVHAKNVPLTADLELHFSRSGYVGLCRLAGGVVNICGLFRKPAYEHVSLPWRQILNGRPGSILHQRLAAADFDNETFCAVAGLSLQPQIASDHPECCVGDAITMIPPMTGNGMSMAFESAELAIEPLALWSCGDLSWVESRSEVASRCDIAFARRLRWASWLQRLMLLPALQNNLVAVACRSDWLSRLAFERTR